MAVPAFQAAGTVVGVVGTTANTAVAWPAHVAGDIGLLIIETAGNATTQIIALATANGFVSMGGQWGNTAAIGVSSSRFEVFWCRATTSSMASPTFDNTGDHATAQIITVRGCLPTGNPWDTQTGGARSAASTSMTWPTNNSTTGSGMVMFIGSWSADSAGPVVSGQANATLSSVTERVDNGSTAGNGGGFVVTTGTRASGVASGTLTATQTTSDTGGYLTISFPEPVTATTTLAIAPSGSLKGAGAITGSTTLSIAPSGSAAAGIIQASGLRQADNVATSSSFNATANFLPGSSILVPMVHYASAGGGVTGVTVGGQAATLDVSATFSSDAHTYLWRVHNFSGSGKAVVVTYGSGSDNYVSLAILEVTGLVNAAPEVSRGTVGSGTSVSVAELTSTVTPNTLTVAAATISNGIMASITTNGGLVDLFKELDGNAHQGGVGGYRVESATGIQTASWTSSASSSWSGVIGSYAIAGSSNPGAMVASTTVSITTTPTLSAKASLVGAPTVSIAPSGSAKGAATLVGSAAVSIAPAATPSASGALVGSTSLSIAPSGTTLGAAALVGAAPVSIAPSGTLLGAAAMVGATSATITPNGNIAGLVPIEAATSVSITPSGTPTATAAAVAAATLSIAPAATLLGSGALVGSASLSITAAASPTAIAPIVADTSLTLSAAGSLTALAAIEASTTLTLAPSGSLAGAGALVGSASLSIAATASPSATVEVAGSTTASLAAAGSLAGAAALVGATSLTIAPTAAPSALATIAGSTTASLAPSGSLGGTGFMVGNTTITITGDAHPVPAAGAMFGSADFSLTASATPRGAAAATGSASLSVTPSAQLVGIAAIAGSVTASLAASGSVQGTAGAVGQVALSIAPQAQPSGLAGLVAAGAVSIDASGSLVAEVGIAGTIGLSIELQGSLSEGGSAAGRAELTIAAVGTLLAIGSMIGRTDLSITAHASPFAPDYQALIRTGATPSPPLVQEDATQDPDLIRPGATPQAALEREAATQDPELQRPTASTQVLVRTS